MNIILNFAQEYSAILIMVIGTLFYFAFEWNAAKKWASGLIIMAEKKSSTWVRVNGPRRKLWVIQQYDRLPKRLKLAIRTTGALFGKNEKEAWSWIVQRVYDLLIQRVKK